MGAWKPEYGRAYRERQRLGVRSTYISTLSWEERFALKVERSAGLFGCWLWKGAKDAGGYGVVNRGRGRSTTAHRDAYEHLVGPVPADLEVDHICRVRACVNPSHLRLLTHRENSRLADHPWGRKPTCVRGHAFTPENTYSRTDHPGRACRACARERQRSYRERVAA